MNNGQDSLLFIGELPIPVSDALRELLGLTQAEILGLLSLFPSESSEPTTIEAIHTTAEVLESALRLIGIARRTALPLGTILQWQQSGPEHRFAQAIGALRAQQPEGEWFDALATIYDPVRENLRDALVAWLTTHRRMILMEGSRLPLWPPAFVTPKALSDALFTDVQVSSCLQTSRLQFAYAAVQRYIDEIRMGFEPGPQSAEQDRLSESGRGDGCTAFGKLTGACSSTQRTGWSQTFAQRRPSSSNSSRTT